MDETAFDRLVRAWSASGSRRRFFGQLSGVPLASLLAVNGTELETIAGARKGRHRASNQRQRRQDALAEACIPTGKPCPSKKPRGKKGKRLSCQQCCQRVVVTDARGNSVCGCQPNGATCTPDTVTTCCSGFCNGTTCQAAARCSAATPCAPLDACHVAGTCDPATGICSHPTAPDGTSCGGGKVCCEGKCVDTSTDPRHCGDCATRCQVTATCDAGICACANGVCNFEGFSCCGIFGGPSLCTCVTNPGDFFDPITCTIVNSCPPERQCVGSGNPVPPGCRACCPAGSTCDPGLGVCLQ